MSEVVPFCRCLQVVPVNNLTLTVYVLIVYVKTLSEQAIAQADIRRSEAMFKFQESLCKICGEQRRNGTGCFSLSICLSPVSIIPSVFQTHLICI